MKKTIRFSKAFLPMVILSSVLIASGVFGLATKGINLGIDFQAGYIAQVKIAPTALAIKYTGAQSVTIELSSRGIDLVMTGVGSDNTTYSYSYVDYPTLGAFAAAVRTIDGIELMIDAPESTPLQALFADSVSLSRLSSSKVYRLHFLPENAPAVSTDDIRAALVSTPDAAVQVVGDPADRTFQIRLKDDGSDPAASENLRLGMISNLVSVFGESNIAVVSSDFVGARFSESLATQVVLLVAATLLLIWIYATIRFGWDFALGAVIAISHDALIIVAFIVWTRMQFNSTTIAAILTIIGYSINDTIVVFDRIRENVKLHPELTITQNLDLSQTEILGRTIITTVTTMLAVSSLFFFTTGDMKDFALALLVGMTSGVYSTIYIASAFISFISRFRKDKGIRKEKPTLVLSKSGEVV